MATNSSPRPGFNPFKLTENSKACPGSTSPFPLLEGRSNFRVGVEYLGSSAEDVGGVQKKAMATQRTADIARALSNLLSTTMRFQAQAYRTIGWMFLLCDSTMPFLNMTTSA